MKILSPLVSRWKKLNEEGYGADAKIAMSKYFALCIEGSPLEDVYLELHRVKSEGASIPLTESFIDRILLSKLKYEWGEEVYDIVKECF